MKANTFLTLAAVLAAMTAQAAPISRQQAQQRAQQFLQGRSGSRRLAPVTQRHRLAPVPFAPGQKLNPAAMQADEDLFYVFDRGEEQGFIIMSGDDQTLPVLGYTDQGSFDYSNLPENMRHWLDGYAAQLRLIRQQPQMAVPVTAVPVHDPVEPMITTKWNQGNPYNLTCPDYFGRGRSVTGCVATAMAQVLYYWHANSPREVQADIPAYDTNTAHATYGKLHVEGIPAGAVIDWDNMIEVYGNNATMQQRMAVANLMHYCGVAVRMDYTNSSSGAFSNDVPDAFKKYFGYGSSVRYIGQGDYTETTWDRALYKEVSEGRPTYLSGASSSGGHAFVCDGYDGNYCYHINWGWGGGGPDGYYLLTSLTPGQQGIGGSGDGYSNGQAAVIGVQLDNYDQSNITFADATVRRLAAENWDADGDGHVSHAEAAAVQDLGMVFAGQRVKNFLELYHFTGLQRLADGAFEGCEQLQNLRLPRHLQHIGARAFRGCAKLKALEMFDEVETLGDDAFNGCAVLPLNTLPHALIKIGSRAMKGCAVVRQLQLPRHLEAIGDSAFAGCVRLTSVGVQSPAPAEWQMGRDLFADVDLSGVTLQVVEGTAPFFAASPEWSAFAATRQTHDRTAGQFAELEVGQTFYLYHVATGRYLTRGEAKGTQAVVGDEPMRFRIGQSSTMDADNFYLYSADTGSSNHLLFRSTSDATVGRGVKAVFVDGANISSASTWCIRAVAPGVYTLQVPEGQSTHVDGEFLGMMPEHVSEAAYPTYGVYSDIPYEGNERQCQWRLVSYDEERAAHFQAAEALQNLLQRALARSLTVDTEQAVLDDINSTTEQIEAAQRRVRHKLGYMNFEDMAVRDICLAQWDLDADGELSDVETRGIQDFGTAFSSAAIADFSQMQLFTSLSSVATNAFLRCSKLQRIVLPQGVTTVGQRAFSRCTALEEVTLPPFISSLEGACFDGCTGLKTVTVAVPDPADINLGSNVFRSVDLSAVTLVVPQGSRQLYAEADVWKDFGTIREMRSRQLPDFSEVVPSTQGYLYNLGARKFLSHGEAYGTQAVVDADGIVYQLRRQGSASASNFTLYSEQTGKDNKTLFRTENDSKVGKGIKTCFVDGTVGTTAIWHLQAVEGLENVFTLQVPESDESYVQGHYLGIQPDHSTNAVSGNTFGLYWDVTLDADPRYCYWAFITRADMEAAQEMEQLGIDLERLLTMARQQQVEAADEQAVFEDFLSTAQQLRTAIASLRTKLQLITFQSERAQKVCVDLWDQNEDDELSRSEAASVATIGQVFRSQPAIQSLEELRFFTGLTAIEADAFRGCSALRSIYLPAGVTTIGENAFANTAQLKYLAALSPQAVVSGAAETGLSKTLQVFVPEALVEAYAADETWGRGTVSAYTGVPTVTAQDAERIYGRANGKFTYEVTGAPINGEPLVSCETDATTAVGIHPITVLPGTITSDGLVCVDGALTINPAPLTVSARSYTRYVGEENPVFEVTYRTFKNREKAEDVILTPPTVECDATPDSPAGTYEIRVFGAEAQNYEFTYEPGTLTVLDPDAVRGIAATATDAQPVTIHDLTGRTVHRTSRPGVYVVGGKKVVR